MKIESAIKLSIGELSANQEPDHVFVTYGSDGKIDGLRWLISVWQSNATSAYSIHSPLSGCFDFSVKTTSIPSG